MFDAIGAFWASQHHLYTAYACFVVAIGAAILAVCVTYYVDHRRKRGREELGRILVELSRCELAAYDAATASQHRSLVEQTEQIKARVQEIGATYFDSSVGARFLAVNVLDTELSPATKDHFISRGMADFWTIYQQIKGWRIFLNDLLRQL